MHIQAEIDVIEVVDDMGWSPTRCDRNTVAGGSGDSSVYRRS
jgi:hypothetical protein